MCIRDSVGPESLSGGPIGKLRDGDKIKIEINKDNCVGRINYVGDVDVFQKRPMNPNLKEDPNMPESVKLWAALQNTGGGTWGGCVPNVREIIKKLNSL